MLQKNNWFLDAFIIEQILCHDSIESQDIAVLSGDLMRLIEESIFFHNLLEVLVKVSVFFCVLEHVCEHL